MDTKGRPYFDKAKELIRALDEAGKPLVVHGLLKAVLIAEANARDAKATSEDNVQTSVPVR